MKITERGGALGNLLVGWGICAVLIAGCYRYPDEIDPALFDLRITELNYNPVAGGGYSSEDLEFIELKNVGSSTVDLSTCSFTEGISYVFPKGAHVDAGGFYVVASNEKGFTSRYGFAPDGVYEKHLGNTADTIVLSDDFTETDILSQTYADGRGWPERPYGEDEGYSLVPRSVVPPKNPSGFEVWRRSVNINGSPGADDILEPLDESLNSLRITEIHYHPAVPDSSGGDSLEFIELKNIGSSDLPLGKVEFTDGIRCAFDSGLTLGAGKFYVLASNSNEFRRRYDRAPDGVYAGKLSNSGEAIVIEAPASNAILLVIRYRDEYPWPTQADGEGYSLVPLSTNPPKNQNDPDLWRASFRIGGSPFADDPGVVVVNEVLSHTVGDDSVELYNPGSDPVDIGGWFLTDNIDIPRKFMIPPGTSIPGEGYLVLTGQDFRSGSTVLEPFSLSSHGDDVYIMADSGGWKKGYWHGFSFGALELGVSVGRYVTSIGKEVFVRQKVSTLGHKNEGPLIGPVVFSEINAALVGIGEYVEITNVSLQEVRLYDPAHPENTWKIDGIDFTFPPAKSIKAGESVVILTGVPNLDEFRTRFHLDTTRQLFTGAQPLDDEGQKLALLKPEEPYIDDSLVSMTAITPYMVIEEIEYHDNQQFWPTCDTSVTVLHRKERYSFGDDPASWKSALPSPGTVDW